MKLTKKDEAMIMALSENILLAQIAWENLQANPTEQFILDLYERILEKRGAKINGN